ncbi:hypothetical protein [Leptospira santarosai]|uniref:hypothetical protein n=1 Tax=Leptospira santarosai TaxID=28183 RepID=UPI0002BDBF01|nr:hypothetical protein [Leptospira santarosai]EMO24073.1 hypothetical protein LEP1GSC168_3401 [Leptospira santarosai str. HAI134]MDI7184469.1 hypothetical protein [Leptospira santarosai]
MEKNGSQSNSNSLDILDDSMTITQIIKTLFIRRKWFFTIFLCLCSVVTLIAYLKRPIDEPFLKFTTYLFVGSYLGQTVPIEHLPSIEFEIKEIYSKNNSPNFAVETEITGNIITISTIALSEEEEKIRKFHERITLPILERHGKLFSQFEKKLMNGALDLSKVSGLSTSVLALAQKTKYVSPLNKVWLRILSIGLLVSFLLACIGVFVLEYIFQLKKVLSEESK